MNWTVLIIVGLLVICIVVFTIFSNLKDKKDFEKKLNNDYPKPYDENGDSEEDEL